MNISKKKFPFFVICVGITCLISLMVGEAAVRLYYNVSGKGGYIWLPDFYLGTVHASNSRFKYQEDFSKEFSVKRKTNSLGLIGEEISIKKPNDVFRILMLGDSFTEGIHVDEGKNFCEQLQFLLNNGLPLAGKRFEVVNAGVSSFSPISEYLFLKRELLRLNPDLIILQMFANDIFEDNRTGAMSVLDDKGLPVKINSFFIEKYLNNQKVDNLNGRLQEIIYKIKKFFVSKSILFQSLARAKKKFRKKTSWHKQMVEMAEYSCQNQFFIIQGEMPLFKDANFRNKAWSNTKKYILAIRNLAREKETQFFMFYIPPEGQLNLKSHRFYEHELYFPYPANYYLNEKLEELSEVEKINYLDLTILFEKNKDVDLYYRKDGHTNEVGHGLIAKGLFNYLVRRKLF